MEPIKPVEPIQPDRLPDMIDVMVTLERPASEYLSSYDRREKYALLKESATRLRENLIEWIEVEALSEEVARMGTPTVFNTLFMTCTPGAAERLVQAPGVVSVLPTGDFEMKLLPRPVEEPSPPDSDDDAPEAES